MLKIALPNKGSLAEESMRLMTEAGYTCRRSQKELFVHDKENEIDFIFLRPRDIAIYVSRGILDLGLTGRDLASEARADVKELLCLGFGRSRFCYAVPEDKNITPFDFSGLKIATSFPHLVSQDLKKKKNRV